MLEGERAQSSLNQEQANRLAESLSALEQELSTTKEQLGEAHAQHQARLGQIEEISAVRDTMKDRANALDNKISELTKEIEAREGIISSKDSKIEELNAALAGFEDKLGERERVSKDREKESAERIRALEEQLSRRDAALRDVESRLGERKAELESRHKETENLTAEISRLSGELSALQEQKEASEKHLGDALKESSGRAEGAEKLVSNLQGRLAEADTRAAGLSHELDATRETAAKELERERNASAGLEKSLAEVRASFEDNLGQAAAQIEDLKTTVSRLDAEIKEKGETLAVRKKEAADRVLGLEDELNQKSDALKKLSRTLADREREVESKEQAAAKLNERISSLDANLKASSEQIREFKAGAKAAEKKLKQHERMVRSAREETERSGKLAKEKDRLVADLQRTLESTRKELAKKTGAELKFSPLEAELSEKERMLAVVRHDVADLQAKYDELNQRAEKSEEKASELQSEKTEGEQEISRYRDRIGKLERTLSERETEEEGRSRELRSRIEKLEEVTEEKIKAEAAAEVARQEIARLRSEHDAIAESLKEQVKEAMKELTKAREASEAQTEKHHRETDALRDRIAQAESVKAAPEPEARPEAVTPAAPEPALAPEAKLEPAETPPVPRTEQIASAEPVEEPEVAESIEEQDIPDADPKVVEELREHSSSIEWAGDFESFQVSDVNAFSVNMTEKIARNPGELYNPLCVYGPSGCGKTHIIHAIGELSTSEDPDLTCALIPISSLLALVQSDKSTIDIWVATVQLLIIDDFQLADVSPALQEKLYLFLSALAEENAQIVIASEEPPIRMNYLQEYFLRFLEGGLLARLEPHPDILEERKAAAEAIGAAAMAMAAQPEPEPGDATPEEAPDGSQAEPRESKTGSKKEFLDEFLTANPSLTEANFRGRRVFGDFEEAFRYPNKKWKNKFPLLIIDEDAERRNHFFHALANKLNEIFDKPVSLLLLDELAEMLALAPSFDWNGLLNKLAASAVVLMDDCESVIRLPDSAAGYMRAIIEDISKRDILLTIGMSKQYKKEPVFGAVFKKASRRKI